MGARCSLLARPQFPPQHLASRRLGERLAKLDQLGHVVAGRAVARVRGPRVEFLGRQRCAGSQDDVRLHRLPVWPSGTPRTQTFEIEGCRYSTASTSVGKTLKPDTMIMSFGRSTIRN
jgi:hypothetical protein